MTSLAMALLVTMVMGRACAEPQTPPEEMAFKLSGNGGNCTGCEWLAAQGTITPTTPKAFQVFLDSWNAENPGVPLDIILNSPGGKVFAAMALGRAIRKAGFLTSVGATIQDSASTVGNMQWQKSDAGVCLDACVLVLLGGRSRSYDPTAKSEQSPDPAKAGFASLHSDDPASLIAVPAAALDLITQGSSIAEIGAGALLGYVVQMGIDPKLLDLATAQAEASGARIISLDEARKLRVSTPEKAVIDWQLRVVRHGLALFGKGDSPLTTFTVALQCYPGQKGALLFEEAVPLRLQDGDTPTSIVKSYGESVSMQIATGASTSKIAKQLPFVYVAGQLMATGVLTPGDVSTIRTMSLEIAYDAPHVYSDTFPSPELSVWTVRESVDLLLKNCPSS